MMDPHVIIVIACVFLCSLFFLLFINKFFRGKTFEEVAAEKRKLAEKLYGPPKVRRQQRKQVPSKKDIKKEKRQKLKESAEKTAVTKENDAESQNDSDIQSETQSEKSSPSHKKVQVEFLEPEIIENVESATTTTGQNRSNVSGEKKKEKQRKNSNTKATGTGILLNKSEPIAVKETLTAEPLNHFDLKPPKDVLELKKQQKELIKDENVEGKTQSEVKPVKEAKVKDSKKSTKNLKKEEKDKGEISSQHQHQQHQVQTQPQEPIAVKEVKHLEERSAKNNDSPKIQNKQKEKKKKVENTVIDHLSGSDVVDVNVLMTLFNQAELNRSEIQILIDYLLNKQQDTPVNHSEWSDDIVQKLKKQLSEKEKALQEEQEASAGIQAKLRDLRTEVNTERIHFNATTKIYMEKLQAKDTEIMNLNQEIQNINEKLNLERQQFQTKLRHEKQASSQELLAQIQQLNEHNSRLQNEIVQLQMIANASHQTAEETKQKMNEIVQQQTNQILALEQSLNDAKEEIGRQQYDLELAKMVENEKENSKVEIRNLQNALDSTQSELNLAQNEIKERVNNLDALNKQIENFKSQIETVNAKYMEQTQNYEQVKITLSEVQAIVDEKDKKIAEYEISIQTFADKEDNLMKQINEQKEKNNELRTKNWKLVEALQKAETSANATTTVNRTNVNLVTQTAALVDTPSSSSSSKDEQRIRELFQRLFPEAARSAAGSALTLSFDQWIEQVVSTHIKQYVNNNLLNRDNNISNNNNNNNTISEENNYNTTTSSNHTMMTTTTTAQSSSTSNHHFVEKSDSSSNYQQQDEIKHVLLENVQLRANVEQLTSIVTKTENLLTNLETQARDQEAHWRNVVQSKQEEIHLLKNLLKNSNGQAI